MIWKSQKISSEQEQHINRCLNEIIIKNPFLNNITECIQKINSTISSIIDSKAFIDENSEMNQIYKYLFLMQEYYTNKENSRIVADLFFKSFVDLFFSVSSNNDVSLIESLLQKLTDNIIYIIGKNILFEDSINYSYMFVLSIINNEKKLEMVKSNVYKVFYV